TPLTITAPATVTGDLYPGATGDLTFEVANPNSFPVVITAVSPNGAITSDGACAGTNVTFVAVTGLSTAVNANATAQSVTLPGAVSMVGNAANECQGATFTVPIAVAAASNVP
ncbi:MAG: hypothetical protein ACXWEI_22645, partial [Mycobacterium sp.]